MTVVASSKMRAAASASRRWTIFTVMFVFASWLYIWTRPPRPTEPPTQPPSPPVHRIPPMTPVLIMVATCRKNFAERIGAIAKTWAANQEVTVWYFVGELVEDNKNPTTQKTRASINRLATSAGVAPSSIMVMDGVYDDEYPPVRRNAAMIAFTANQLHSNADYMETVKWIMKVDDDTLVNIPALLRFLQHDRRNTNPRNDPQTYGSIGYGRPGPDREGMKRSGFEGPFCMGGPGYIMSVAAVLRTAVGMSDCVAHIDKSPERTALWHSDLVIGFCVHRKTRVTCWDHEKLTRIERKVKSKLAFVENYEGIEDFVTDGNLTRTITMHPLKNRSSMIRQHARCSNAEISKPSRRRLAFQL